MCDLTTRYNQGGLLKQLTILKGQERKERKNNPISCFGLHNGVVNTETRMTRPSD